MKCKRCGNDMRRQRLSDNRYRYVCPVCGLVIGGTQASVSEEKKSDEETQ